MRAPSRATRSPPAQLAAAITPRTKLLLLNSPSNPTGAAYTKAELQALGAVLDQHPQIVIASDEMYEHIYWAAEPFTSFAQANPQLYDRTITINGVSKAYAMTGWRIGYCGGPEGNRGRDVDDSGPVHLECLEHFAARRDRGAERRPGLRRRDEQGVQGSGMTSWSPVLNAIPGISCLPGAGTFYAFAQMSKAPCARWASRTTMTFAEYLLVRSRRRRGTRIRIRRAGPYAHLLRLQHGDPGGRAAPHPASADAGGREARLKARSRRFRGTELEISSNLGM